MTTTRKTQILLLAAMTTFCVALCITRIVLTGEINYLFLNWNLFLAFVPLGVTFLFELLVKESSPFAKSGWVKMGVLGVWLIFFPNAPYILTDLFHMRHEDSAPQWFDLILILSYAWTGLMAGFISLFDIEKYVLTFRLPWMNLFTVIFLIFLTGFGIYLGRYLRFNSWDLWNRPGHLFLEIGDRFIHPLSHTRTWGMTIGMGVLLNFIYWSIRPTSIRSNHSVLSSDRLHNQQTTS